MNVTLDYINKHIVLIVKTTKTLDDALFLDIVASTRDGERTALTWKEDYRPGGPWCYAANPNADEAKKLLAKHTQDCHNAWMEGFDKIIAKRGYDYTKKA